MKRLSKSKREQAELILQHAATIQTVYWDLLHDLEEILDCEVDGTTDLNNCNTHDLQKASGL